MPLVKRYNFQARQAMLSSQFNTNFDDIITAYNAHQHTNTGTDAALITSSGLAPGAVTSGKLKPGTATLTGTAGANFTTTSASFTDVTGMSTTYTTGTSAETVFAFAGAMGSVSAPANAAVTLSINGTDQTPNMYFTSSTASRQEMCWQVSIPANTVATIKLRAKTDANTLTINFGSVDFVPSIRLFAFAS